MADKPLSERLKDILSKATVEPFIFLVMFGYNVRLITMQSLLHDRACRSFLGASDFVCDHIDDHKYAKEQLEAVKIGNNVYVGLVMASTIPALVIATFVGPWSDRYSRKLPMLISCTGIFVDTAIQSVITSFQHSSLYWYIISGLISGFTGGLLIVLSSTYSYMSDITNERSRQIRFAVLEFFTLMATPMGSFIGGKIYKAGGYLPVIITGTCSFGLALLYAWFVVAETKPKMLDTTRKQIFADLFNIDNMKESFRTSVKPRAGNLRLQIWLLVGVSFITRLINFGALSIGFSYTRNTFKWDVERYSNTMTIFSMINGLATITIVPLLNKKLMVHEAGVGFIGILSLTAKLTLLSVAVYEWILFYAWILGCLYACAGIAIRSRISKLVPRHELGKVFSLLATFDSPTPVLGNLILAQIYNVSYEFYSGLAYAVSAAILLPAAAVFAWMMHLPTMSLVQYEESEESKGMKELKDVSNNVF